MFCKNDTFKNFAKLTGKPLYQSLFFRPEACNFNKKEALNEVFSCEYCEYCEYRFYRTSPVAVSGKIRPKSLKSAKFQFQLFLTALAWVPFTLVQNGFKTRHLQKNICGEVHSYCYSNFKTFKLK